MRMSWTLSVPLCQMSHISRLPLCYVASSCGVDDLDLYLASFAFDLFTEKLAKTRRSLRTWVCVKAFQARSAIPSKISLYRSVKRPPRLQSREWYIEKFALQPSQYFGMSGGSRPYRRKRSSCHPFAPIPVPFTVDGCTFSHAPVFIACRKQRAPWT